MCNTPPLNRLSQPPSAFIIRLLQFVSHILMSHHFPQTAAVSQAHEIAQLIMEGFDRHYQLFRAESTKAKHRFEAQDWHGQQ